MKRKLLVATILLMILSVSMVMFAACGKEEIKTYEVNFHYNTGVDTDNLKLTVKENEKVYEPKEIARDGYVFKGWFSNEDLTTAFDFKAAITANSAAYAKWLKINAVTFNSAGGSAVEPENAVLGDVVTLPAAPTKADSKFVAWINGSTEFAPGDSYTMREAAVEFTAKWKNIYTVTFLDFDGTPIGEPQKVEEGAAATEPEMEDELGFYYAGGRWDTYDFGEVTENLTVTYTYDTIVSAESHFAFVGYNAEDVVTETEAEIAYYLVGRNTAEGVAALPANLVLPSEHAGKPVKGIVDGTNKVSAFGIQTLSSDADAPVQKVFIPKSYERVGDYAFYSATNLKELIFEKGSALSVIGQYAFAGGTTTATIIAGLKSVEIPSSVVEIEQYAFTSNELENVTFEPSSKLETIGKGVFSKGSAALVAYKDFVLPKSVVTIGDEAFKTNMMTAIEFEEGTVLETIGKNAFNGTGLISIVLPKSLITLNDYAFVEAKSLQKVTFENDIELETIGNYAFDKTAINDIQIPASVTKIGNYAFRQTLLTSIFIPNTVNEIGNYAFNSATRLVDIVFEEGLNPLKIGNSAFAGDNTGKYMAYTNISIAKRVSEIGTSAFTVAPLLTTVTFETGDDAQNLKIGNYAFAGYTSRPSYGAPIAYTNSIKSLFLPSRIKTIGTDSFAGLLRMQTLEIEAGGIANIPDYAFAYNPNMKVDRAKTLPEGITTIGMYAFSCKEMYVSNGYAYNPISSMPIPARNIAVSYIIIPASVTEIKDFAFAYYQNAAGIKFAKPADGTAENPLKIGKASFGSDKSAEICLPSLDGGGIVIPSRVTTLGDYAFGYTKIGNIEFEENSILTTIPKGCFIGNTNIYFKTVVIPDSVTTIKSDAFKMNTSLEQVYFGIDSKIAIIEASAFAGDGVTGYSYEATGGALRNIYIGKNVTSLAYDAFLHQAVLENIEVHADNEKYCAIDGVLYEKDANGNPVKLLKFPAYSSIVDLVIPETVTEISMYAFTDTKLLKTVDASHVIKFNNSVFINSSIESIVLNSTPLPVTDKDPKTLTELSAGMFIKSNLANIVIPNNVGKIGTQAFKNCTNLTSITLPTNEQFVKIDTSTFEGCINLTNITLPSSINTLSSTAFAGSGLKSIELSNNIKEISSSAFRYCNSIEKIIVPANADSEVVVTINQFAFAEMLSLKTIEFKGKVKFYNGALSNMTNVESIIFSGDSIPDVQGATVRNFITSSLKNIYVKAALLPAMKTFVSTYFTDYNGELSAEVADSLVKDIATMPVA